MTLINKKINFWQVGYPWVFQMLKTAKEKLSQGLRDKIQGLATSAGCTRTPTRNDKPRVVETVLQII